MIPVPPPPTVCTSNVTATECASALLRVFEGCRLAAYADSGGVWSIGFGSTHMPDGRSVAHGDTITQAQADALLFANQQPLLKAVAGRPVLEQAALISFGYNCGLGALERVLGGHALLTDFVKDARGVELPGLVSRRQLEESLILVSQQGGK